MANIEDKVTSIRQAVYGKDVRESIASGIEAINTECENTTGRQNVIDAQEQSRIDAENIRKSNELDRQFQETSRQNDEVTRQTNENTRINNENIRETNENTRQSVFNSNENDRSVQFNSLKNEITEAVGNANTAVTNTNIATSNYNSVVEQTRKIYKPSVNIFSDLSTTYPSPIIGWTSTCKDSNIEYRWDGTEWMDIGNSDPSIGLNVVVGSIAPTNPNSIWLEASESTRYARVIPSITEPADLSQIWWKMDN